MATIETDLVQQSPSGTNDAPVVIMLASEVAAVDGVISTDLVQQPATGGARDVQVVIAVNADGSPISGGGSGGDLPTGTQYQIMGFNATTGQPEARVFLSQMWGDLVSGFPNDSAWVAILRSDGSHAFTPASRDPVAGYIPVRNARGALTSVEGVADDEVVTVGQLFDLINRVAALENA